MNLLVTVTSLDGNLLTVRDEGDSNITTLRLAPTWAIFRWVPEGSYLLKSVVATGGSPAWMLWESAHVERIPDEAA